MARVSNDLTSPAFQASANPSQLSSQRPREWSARRHWTLGAKCTLGISWIASHLGVRYFFLGQAPTRGVEPPPFRVTSGYSTVKLRGHLLHPSYAQDEEVRKEYTKVPGRPRTGNLRLTRSRLCQLSYRNEKERVLLGGVGTHNGMVPSWK